MESLWKQSFFISAENTIEKLYENSIWLMFEYVLRLNTSKKRFSTVFETY